MTIAPADTARRFRQVLTTREQLREVYPPPSETAARKDIGRLDPHSRRFLALSPFVLLGTCGAAGNCDVSPKGDRPGFVRVLDDHTLVIPDRVGNRRIDSLQNIVENPHVGLLFVVPGLTETLRVNGSAIVVRDDDLLDSMAVDGKRPTVAIVVTIAECYMHCAKAFLRSELWNPARFVAPADFPSLARVILDQTRPPGRSDDEHEQSVAAVEERHAEAYRCLY